MTVKNNRIICIWIGNSAEDQYNISKLWMLQIYIYNIQGVPGIWEHNFSWIYIKPNVMLNSIHQILTFTTLSDIRKVYGRFQYSIRNEKAFSAHSTPSPTTSFLKMVRSRMNWWAVVTTRNQLVTDFMIRHSKNWWLVISF